MSKPEPATAITIEQFVFDPNTASEESLGRLGFDERTAKQIINYRNKGGVFRIKNDLFKIYSIDSALVQSLMVFIDLPVTVKKKTYPVKRPGKESSVKDNRPVVTSKPQPVEKFDLNLADTAMLQTVNGIGSVLSKRIITFRDKLGGFVYDTQVYEVYNLDSVVAEKLLEVSFLNEQSRVQKININAVSQETLESHPYISRKQARLIVAYRNQHGKFNTGDDLLKVYLVNEPDVHRLLPYLQFD